MRALFAPLPALLAVLALAPAARPACAAGAPPSPPPAPGAAAALGAAPAMPTNYSVDMKIHADGKDITLTRYSNENGDMRMDIQSEQGAMEMIQLNDEKQTMYSVMPERKEVMKQSRASMMKQAEEHAPGKTAPDSAQEGQGTVELVGHEEVNGVMADKYKVTSEGMEGTMWIDPQTHLIQRLQAENGTIDFTNYKIGSVTAEAFQPPKDYKLTDMDEMMAKMPHGMGGMAQSMIGGMAGGMGSSLGANLGGQAGGALGGMVGGPLGRMAGTYLGNKLGAKLGRKAGSAAGSKM